jgi:short-subunit dehydrogenase
MSGVLIVFILIVLIYALSYYIYKTYLYFPPIKIEQLRNKCVIITGASRGIGEELAYEYSRYNCRLMLAARSIDILRNKVADNCRQLGARQVECMEFDASDESACIQLIKKTVEFYGGVDILILNHTASVYQPFFQSDINQNIQNMKKLFDTNFFGYFHTSKIKTRKCSILFFYFKRWQLFRIY